MNPEHEQENKRITEMFAKAKKHPSYYLEGLEITFGERLVKLKADLKKSTRLQLYVDYEKVAFLNGKIAATRRCLKDVIAEGKQSNRFNP